MGGSREERMGLTKVGGERIEMAGGGFGFMNDMRGLGGRNA